MQQRWIARCLTVALGRGGLYLGTCGRNVDHPRFLEVGRIEAIFHASPHFNIQQLLADIYFQSPSSWCGAAPHLICVVARNSHKNRSAPSLRHGLTQEGERPPSPEGCNCFPDRKRGILENSHGRLSRHRHLQQQSVFKFQQPLAQDSARLVARCEHNPAPRIT